MGQKQRRIRNGDEITVDDGELGVTTDDFSVDGPAPGHPTPWQVL